MQLTAGLLCRDMPGSGCAWILCRGLGTLEILCILWRQALQGPSDVERCRDTLHVGTAGIILLLLSLFAFFHSFIWE